MNLGIVFSLLINSFYILEMRQWNYTFLIKYEYLSMVRYLEKNKHANICHQLQNQIYFTTESYNLDSARQNYIYRKVGFSL